ncbi:hypothetical protein E2C01_038346 [Portunus trituberculatus]|uniref:Uncharacterized protein n=1 Tax=Portunus trituberculatus TaxID=210409 RepID=A0A5B7FIB1_PORTR|nr:hypothetical protein [Portunus trituberculatus]
MEWLRPARGSSGGLAFMIGWVGGRIRASPSRGDSPLPQELRDPSLPQSTTRLSSSCPQISFAGPRIIRATVKQQKSIASGQPRLSHICSTNSQGQGVSFGDLKIEQEYLGVVSPLAQSRTSGIVRFVLKALTSLTQISGVDRYVPEIQTPMILLVNNHGIFFSLV